MIYSEKMRSLALAVTFLSFTLESAPADVQLKSNDFVAICGDSITQQRLYSVALEDYFLMCQPASNLRAAQFGRAGEVVPAFLLRMGSELFPFQPTVVTTCYGMNDGLYAPLTPEVAKRYRDATTQMVETMKQHGVRTIVVGSPPCVDSNSFRDSKDLSVMYTKTLAGLSAIAREVAGKEGISYAAVNETMTDVMAKAKAALGQKFVFPSDGVHPFIHGHLVIAYSFLKALGCDGSIGTIKVNLASGKAEGTSGQKVSTVTNGTVEIESTRYPYCFIDDPTRPESTVGILRFLPFNEDLNRYLLVVHGLKTPHAKITWGNESREFSAADLDKGVNLAAAFLVNPFTPAFKKVDAAVQLQQQREIALVQEKNVAEDKTLFQDAAALVAPVHHTIKIEPMP